jgi:type IV secretory pathway TrbD component
MKKYIWVLGIVLTVILVFSIGCASSNSSVASRDMMDEGFIPPAPSASPGEIFPTSMGGYAESPKDAQWAADGDGSISVDIERKIIKTGYMTLVVKDVEQSLDEISAIAGKLGGFVVSSSKSGDEDSVRGNMAIRVPAEKYDEAITELRAIAVQVPDESTDTQDVTEEYIDLTARLSSLEATEAQYLELLKKAETVEDILNVQQALSNIRQDIESLKGRIQYIERTSDMSLININIREEATFQEKGWEAGEIFKSAVRALVAIGQFLGSAIIYIVVILAIPAIIGIAIWQIVVAVKRRKKKANQ